jgi:hypothetical protein
MKVTQTQVETVRRIDISVAPADAKKDSSMASVTGFYGTAISPGVQPVSWSGLNVPGAPPPAQGTPAQQTPTPTADPDNTDPSGSLTTGTSTQ